MPTEISWCQETWNPTTGCDKVSPGCDNCYALTLAGRLKAMETKRIELETLAPANAKYQTDGDPTTSGPGFGVATHEDTLTQPLRWKQPRVVFVNSMSDLFHKDIPAEYIAKVFAVMAATPQHTYQVLTKRHGRMRSLLSSDKFRLLTKEMHSKMQISRALPYRPLVINVWPLRNVWLGVSVENQQWADTRILTLMRTPAAVRFLSCEPLLGPIQLHRGHAHCPTHDFAGGFCSGGCPDLIAPNWVICGGESGPGARPMHLDWARRLRDDCAAAGVPFHFKQTGTEAARELGISGKGDKFDELPGEFQIRQYPAAAMERGTA